MTAAGRDPDLLDGRAVVSAAAVTIASFLTLFLAGTLALQIDDSIHFDESALGLSVTAYFATTFVTASTSGAVVARVGPSSGMQISALLSAVSLLVGAATPNLPTFVAAFVIGGCASSIALPATNLLISQTVGPSRMGLAFGLRQAAAPATTLIAGLAVPTVGLVFGWRWAFVAGAVFAALAMLTVPKPRDAVYTTTRPDPTESGPVQSRQPIVVLAVSYAFGTAATQSGNSFLVSGGVEAGLSEGVAAIVLAGGSALGVASRILMGVRADRRGRRHLRTVIAMMIVGCVAMLLFAAGTPPTFIAGALAFYGAGWAWPGLLYLALAAARPKSLGPATGLMQMGASAGAVVGPFVFGLLAKHQSFTAAWLAGAASLAGSSMLMTTARRMLVREAQLAVVDA